MAAVRGLLFFICLAPFAIGFAFQDQLASFGDDSASYLAVAHWIAPSGDPRVAAWAGYHANFPPLFPLLLALTGGVYNYGMATVLVGLLGAGGVALFYRYAAHEVGERAGLATALLFLLTTTAWITLKGVLSETLFLMAVMAALLYFETRVASTREPRALQWVLFGLLLAAAALSRAIGILLLGAYLIHVFVRVFKERRVALPACVPVLVCLAFVVLWYVIRPRAPTDMYGMAVGWVLDWWLADPGKMVKGAWFLFLSGWTRSFMASEEVTMAAVVVFAIVGLLGLAEAVIRAERNRLDGWFVLLSLAVIFVWTFSPETTRRLLYALVPLMILFAVSLVRSLLARANLTPRRRTMALAGIAAFPVLLTLPALAIVARKSFDHRPVVAGCPQQFREITPYYSTLNQEEAEKAAVLEVTMLCGLQSIAKVTPPGSVIMWSRPEYVTVLGHRPAVPLFYRWNADDLAAALKKEKVDYLVVSALFKNDIQGGRARDLSDMKIGEITKPHFQLTEGIFALREVLRGQTPGLGDRPAAKGK
jgi:hypothetical protein